jgi:hypothetical protein
MLWHVCVTIDGVWIETGFIGHLQVVTTNNYNTIANLHTLQITVAYRLVFSVCYNQHYSFPGNGLLTVEILQLPRSHHCPLALNCTDQVFSSQTSLQLTFTTELPGWRLSHTNILVSSSQTHSELSTLASNWLPQTVPVITSRHGLQRKHRFPQFLYCCARTRFRWYLFVSLSLRSNGSTRYKFIIEFVF